MGESDIPESLKQSFKPPLTESFLNVSGIEYNPKRDLAPKLLKTHMSPYTVVGDKTTYVCLVDLPIEKEDVGVLVHGGVHTSLIYPDDFPALVLGVGNPSLYYPRSLSSLHIFPAPLKDEEVFVAAYNGPDDFTPVNDLKKYPWSSTTIGQLLAAEELETRIDLAKIQLYKVPDNVWEKIPEFRNYNYVNPKSLNGKVFFVVNDQGIDIVALQVSDKGVKSIIHKNLYRNHFDYSILPAIAWQYDEHGKPRIIFDLDSRDLILPAIDIFERKYPYIDMIKNIRPTPNIDSRRVNAVAGALSLFNLDDKLHRETDFSMLGGLVQFRDESIYEHSSLFKAVVDWQSSQVAKAMLS